MYKSVQGHYSTVDGDHTVGSTVYDWELLMRHDEHLHPLAELEGEAVTFTIPHAGHTFGGANIRVMSFA